MNTHATEQAATSPMFGEILDELEWHISRPPATAGRQGMTAAVRVSRARVTALARLQKARQQPAEHQDAGRLGAMTRAANIGAITDGETRRKTAAQVLGVYLRGATCGA